MEKSSADYGAQKNEKDEKETSQTQVSKSADTGTQRPDIQLFLEQHNQR